MFKGCLYTLKLWMLIVVSSGTVWALTRTVKSSGGADFTTVTDALTASTGAGDIIRILDHSSYTVNSGYPANGDVIFESATANPDSFPTLVFTNWSIWWRDHGGTRTFRKVILNNPESPSSLNVAGRSIQMDQAVLTGYTGAGWISGDLQANVFNATNSVFFNNPGTIFQVTGVTNDNFGTIYNSTFYNNGAVYSTVAISSGDQSIIKMHNCIFVGNVTIASDNDVIQQWTYALVENASDAGKMGTGVQRSTDPVFVNGSGSFSRASDFRLLPTARSVDRGTNTGAPANDLESKARPYNVTTDIGAFEYTPIGLGIYALNPLDNATQVARGGLLSITFNDQVNIGSGNITVHRASDQSVLHTLPVTSDYVLVGDSLLNGFENGKSVHQYLNSVDAVSFWLSNVRSYSGLTSACIVASAATGGAGRFYFDDWQNLSEWDSLIVYVYTPDANVNASLFTDSRTDLPAWKNGAYRPLVQNAWTRLALPKDSILDPLNVITYGIQVNKASTLCMDHWTLVKNDYSPSVRLAMPAGLPTNTEHYVQIPNTAFKTVSNNYFSGIQNTTDWSFTTAGKSWTWDNSTAAGYQAGSGTWGVDSYWSADGTVLHPWYGLGNKAIFAGTSGAYTITLSDRQGVDTLQFDQSGYSLTGSTLQFGAINSALITNADAQIASIILGSHKKTGAGRLTLNGSVASNYANNVTVEQGVLALSKTDHTNAINGNLTLAGGHLVFLNKDQFANTLNLTIGANSTFNGIARNNEFVAIEEELASITQTGGLVQTGMGGSILTVTGATTITGGSDQPKFIVNSQTVATFNSLSLNGMTGLGELDANNFSVSGNSTVSQTLIKIGASGLTLNGSHLSFRRGGSANTLGGRLVLGGNIVSSGASSIRIDSVGGAIGTVHVDLGGAVGDVSRTITVNSGGELQIRLPIENGLATNASLIKNGNGVLRLSAVNTFNQGYSHSQGDLRIDHSQALGSGSAVMNGSGRIYLQNGVNVANSITIDQCAPGIEQGAIMVDEGDTATWSGAIRVDTACTNGGLFSARPNGVLYLTGPLNTTSGGVPYHRYGTVVYSGGGNVTEFQMIEGLAKLGAHNGLPTSAYWYQSHDYLSSTLDLNGFNQSLRAVGSQVNAGTSEITNTQATLSTLTLTGTVNRTYREQITGNIAIVKEGTYRQTLSGVNSYTGPTTVNSGILRLNGSTHASSTVTVNSGAVLMGSGTAGGAVNIANGGTIEPGSSGIGNLHVGGNLNMNPTCTLSVELGAVSDTLKVTGNINLSGFINVTAVSGFGEGVYTVATAGGSITGSSLTLGRLPTTYNYSVSVSGQNVLLTVSLSQYTWDLSADAGTQSGPGIWGTDSYWSQNGVLLEAWPGSGAIARFAGGNGNYAITVIDTQRVDAIRFENTGYVLSGGVLSLTGSNPYINNSANAIIQSPMFGPLTKMGIGELTLTGNYSGNQTQVQSGTLILQIAANDAFDANVMIESGATLKLGDMHQIHNSKSVHLNASDAVYDQNNFNEVIGTLSGSGLVYNNTELILDMQNGVTSQFSGIISGTGSLRLRACNTTNSEGQIILSNQNSYSGLTGVASANDTWGCDSAKVSMKLVGGNNRISPLSKLTFGQTGKFGMTGTLILGDSSGPVVQEFAGLNDTLGGGAYSIVAGSDSISTLAINNHSGEIFNGMIGGPNDNENQLKVIKSGSGFLRLSGINTWSGGYIHHSGITNATNSSSFGSGEIIFDSAGYVTLDSGVNLSQAMAIDACNPGAGNGVFRGPNSGSATLSGNLVIKASCSSGGHFHGGNGSGGLVIRGAINAPDSVTIVSRNYVNVFSGGGNYKKFRVFQYRAMLGDHNGISNGAVLSLGSDSLARLDMNGFNQTLGGIYHHVVDRVFVSNTSATASVLTLHVLDMIYLYNGLIDGNISLIKTGHGIQILAGANGYTGTTQIQSGALIINGSLDSSSAIQIQGGGALSGHGDIAGPVYVSHHGMIDPGYQENRALRIGSLTLEDSSVVGISLGSDQDTLVVQGDLVLDGIMTITEDSGLVAGVYPVIQYSGNLIDQGIRLIQAGEHSFVLQYSPGAVYVRVGAHPVFVSDTLRVNVAENSTVVTTLLATDSDNDALTYSIVGGSDSIRFALDSITGALAFKNAMNFEAPQDADSDGVYWVYVQAKDSYGGIQTQWIQVTLSNVNELPLNILPPIITIAENISIGTSVATLTTIDTDLNDSHSYALVAGSGDSHNSQFSIHGNQLLLAEELDFETMPSLEIRVRSTDQGGLWTEAVLMIDVLDANDAPTSISISADSIAENSDSNTLIGLLSGTDPDLGDVLSFSLPSGVADNSMFSIVGTQLRSAQQFNYEQDSNYSVIVRVSDGELSVDRNINIRITNVNEKPVLANGGFVGTILDRKLGTLKSVRLSSGDTIYAHESSLVRLSAIVTDPEGDLISGYILDSLGNVQFGIDSVQILRWAWQIIDSAGAYPIRIVVSDPSNANDTLIIWNQKPPVITPLLSYSKIVAYDKSIALSQIVPLVGDSMLVPIGASLSMQFTYESSNGDPLQVKMLTQNPGLTWSIQGSSLTMQWSSPKDSVLQIMVTNSAHLWDTLTYRMMYGQFSTTSIQRNESDYRSADRRYFDLLGRQEERHYLKESFP